MNALGNNNQKIQEMRENLEQSHGRIAELAAGAGGGASTSHQDSKCAAVCCCAVIPNSSMLVVSACNTE